MNLHGMMHDRAPVAQLDRAPDFESVGRRFESCRARQINSKCRMQNANTRCLQHWGQRRCDFTLFFQHKYCLHFEFEFLKPSSALSSAG